MSPNARSPKVSTASRAGVPQLPPPPRPGLSLNRLGQAAKCWGGPGGLGLTGGGSQGEVGRGHDPVAGFRPAAKGIGVQWTPADTHVLRRAAP